MEHWILVIITNPSSAFTDALSRSSMLLFDSMDFKAINPQQELENFMREE